MSEAICGSRNTSTGSPCRQPVSEPGETCWREDHIPAPDYADGLTHKQRRFVEEYTGPANFNATEAARRAGYSENTASEIGYENLNKPQIKQAVERRLEQMAMAADEVLVRLAEMARGSVEEFIEVNEDGRFRIDLQEARRAGKLHLVRELAYDSNGLPKVKMYSALQALKQLAKAHGLMVDKVEHSGEIDGRVQVREVVVNRPSGSGAEAAGNGAGPERIRNAS